VQHHRLQRAVKDWCAASQNWLTLVLLQILISSGLPVGRDARTESTQVNSPLEVDYYTDVLCIRAWIAQHRIDEIEKKWGDKFRIKHHCVNVFGDTLGRIGEKWSNRRGYAGFAEHVEESAATLAIEY